MLRIHRLGLVLVLAITATSCATVVTSPYEEIRVQSDPPGAAAVLTCHGKTVDTIETPAVFRIRRNAGDCTLEIAKRGYTKETVLLEQGVNPAVWGNFGTLPFAVIGLMGYEPASSRESHRLGGVMIGASLIGWGVDFATGAAHCHRPAQIDARLTPEASASPPPN